ncbi:MAG: glycosyltransferase [Leptolyngbyaceae cyanobacterium bins.59]|nr:glycosyltransferase [Leptolyngbyaceae cyanobacterium bins.59]
MTKHYLFFIREPLPKAEAHTFQVVQCANAAANLGYSTVLSYYGMGASARNPLRWVTPLHPEAPDAEFSQFYSVQGKLQVNPLPMPWPIEHWRSRWTDANTIATKYYLPVHFFPKTQIVHTRDWNCVKAAIQSGIPVIYEHHHHEDRPFEPEIVKHSLFQISVTVADTVRDSMIACGMPSEKVIKLHNGFNRAFAVRNPEKITALRQQLLPEGRSRLVVYSGALYRFKGVDLLLEIAPLFPTTQFVMAGGKADQVEEYRQQAQARGLNNVTFLGHVTQQYLSVLLQSADVLAHPHLSGKEASFTSPLKLFDYLASGTPIVATTISTLQEFQGAGVVAGWCEPDNPQQYAQCLQQILDQYPFKVDGYGTASNFLEQFSWENRIEKILSYVEESKRPIARAG